MRSNKIVYFIVGGLVGLMVFAFFAGMALGVYRQKALVKDLARTEYHKYLARKKEGVFTAIAAAKHIPVGDEATEIRVNIDADKIKGKISPLLYGVNLSPQTESELDIIEFAKDTGFTMFRFPGGESPGYHWKSGIFDYNPRVASAPFRDIDYLIDFCRKTNTRLLIQVNVESGTPKEAAAWVAHMKESGFPVAYWELGNEVYADWDKAYMSGSKYGDLIRQYAVAMKQVDPTIKIGMDWAPTRREFFNRAALKKAGKYVDFVSIHWYPNHTSAKHPFNGKIHPTVQEVMAGYLQIPSIIKRVRYLFSRYAPENKNVEMTFLEWDGAWDGPSWDCPPYSQGIAQWSLANALFHADCLGTFAEENVSVSAAFTFQAIGFGMIRGWDKRAGDGGQRWDGRTIRPKAFAIQLFAKHFGDTLIASSVDGSPAYGKASDWWPDSYSGVVPYITAYASVDSREKILSLVVINKHETKDYKIRVNLNGFHPADEAKLYVLTGPDLWAENDGNPGAVGVQEYTMKDVKEDFYYTVPPRSVNCIKMRPK